MEEKIIELSKNKIITSIIGSTIFVLLGVWFLSMDAQTIESQEEFNSPIFVYGFGIISIVFFGLCDLIWIKKFLDKSPGLVISSKGILDNSSGVSAGVVPWEDISGIEEYQVKKQKFISIQVNNPEKYVNNGNPLQRMIHRANIKMCGTPVNISTNSLKISHKDLLGIITEYYQKHGGNA